MAGDQRERERGTTTKESKALQPRCVTVSPVASVVGSMGKVSADREQTSGRQRVSLYNPRHEFLASSP